MCWRYPKQSDLSTEAVYRNKGRERNPFHFICNLMINKVIRDIQIDGRGFLYA